MPLFCCGCGGVIKTARYAEMTGVKKGRRYFFHVLCAYKIVKKYAKLEKNRNAAKKNIRKKSSE